MISREYAAPVPHDYPRARSQLVGSTNTRPTRRRHSLSLTEQPLICSRAVDKFYGA